MRSVIASVFVISLFSSPLAAGQAPSGAGKPAIKACSLLSRELAMKVSSEVVNKIFFDQPPREEPVGTSGSACDYAGIRLQIDPFPWSVIEAAAKKNERGAGSKRSANWIPVSGVGDRAYFNGDTRFAELMGQAGGHTFTIQLGVPIQSTAEKMKPNVITLANAIVAKLK